MIFAYLAGKYRASTPEGVEHNIRVARVWGNAVNRTGLAWALVPHNCSEGMQASLTEEGWLAYTAAFARRSDGLIMLPAWTESDGSIGEHNDAVTEGRPWVLATTLAAIDHTVRALVEQVERRR